MLSIILSVIGLAASPCWSRVNAAPAVVRIATPVTGLPGASFNMRAPATLNAVTPAVSLRPASLSAPADSPATLPPGGVVIGDEAKARLEALIQARFTVIEAAYKDFHQYPELSGQEKVTGAKVAAHLRELGFEVTSGVGGHGVVSVLRNGAGPTLMIRADMDALPVTEQTGLPYASKVPGVMHACGHDLHTTILLSVAHALSQMKEHWKGTLVLVAQPAEELAAGANAMIADGLFTRFPKPDFALALHGHGALVAGKIGYRTGYSYASADMFDITLHGKGGHGAQPHLAIDPVVMQAELVLKLQTVVGREIDPLLPALITAGLVQAGTRGNIIPPTAVVQGTFRTYDPQVREFIRTRITEVTKGIAANSRAPEPEVKFPAGTPSVYNDPAMAEKLLPAFRAAVGAENVVEVPPGMVAEDFAEYSRQGGFPSTIFFVGAQKSLEPPVHVPHSPFFHPDFEPALKTGTKAMAAAALALFGTPTARAD